MIEQRTTKSLAKGVPYPLGATVTGDGLNAVELLPVHEHYLDDFLVERGQPIYWGYNSIAFFAPESSYGGGRMPGCQVNEFKTLLRTHLDFCVLNAV